MFVVVVVKRFACGGKWGWYVWWVLVVDSGTVGSEGMRYSCKMRAAELWVMIARPLFAWATER